MCCGVKDFQKILKVSFINSDCNLSFKKYKSQRNIRYLMPHIYKYREIKYKYREIKYREIKYKYREVKYKYQRNIRY